MDALIGLAGFIGIIVSVIVLIIKAIKKKPKKKPLIALAICFALFVIALFLPSSGNSSLTSTPTETPAPTETLAPTETPAPTDFEVSINATAHKEGTAVVFEIDTNMPDDTQLMLT